MRKKASDGYNMSRIQVIKKDFKVNKSLYLLFLPVLIYFIVFCYGPMYGTIIAFKDFRAARGIMGSAWVGFKHFERFFSISTFQTVLFNTLKFSITTLIFSFPVPIALAILVNELPYRRFGKVIQNATYLPHFISLVVVCGMIKDFTSNTGVVTQMLSIFGVPQISLLSNPDYFLPIFVISGIWQSAGWSSIIYLSALTSIDNELYEAASIDGAGKLRQLIHISLPGIAPIIITQLILKLGHVMSVGYEKILLLSNDSIIDVTEVISTYVYRVGLLNHSYSYATAVSLFNSLINIILLLITNKISRVVSETSLW